MPRTALPLHAEDISAFAKSLRRQLAGRSDPDRPDTAPGHLELLNMLSRAAGFRNFQHLRAQAAAEAPPRTDDRPEPRARAVAPVEPVEPAKLKRLARYFDPDGRLIRWPGKFSHVEPCLWVLWTRIAPHQPLTEPQVNRTLQAGHLFGDHVLLRRALCDYRMLTRTPDGREYRRIEQQPSPEGLALLRHLRDRTAAPAHH